MELCESQVYAYLLGDKGNITRGHFRDVNFADLIPYYFNFELFCE